MSICTPIGDVETWREGLRRLSEGAFGFSRRFVLRGYPADRNGDGDVDEEDIELRIDGVLLEPVKQGEPTWRFEPGSNAIDFTPLYLPPVNAAVTATYRTACSR